ncbi:MAG: TRAP transporter large permease subunit [Deltaproteobacteria bacterium]
MDPLTYPKCHGPVRVIAVIVLVHLIGGCFMDGFALVVLTVPILLPLIHTLAIRDGDVHKFIT